MKIVAVIPARGGSKRIPKKNIKLLAGKPLIAYTIEEAKKSEYIDDVYVSTDDDEIGNVALFYGAKVIKRPAELATDEADTESVLLHAIKYLDHDYVVLLQPTSPLRTVRHIDKGIKLCVNLDADSVISLVEMPLHFLAGRLHGKSYYPGYDIRPRSQEVDKKYRENGAVYVMKKYSFLKYKNRLCGKIKGFVMNTIESIDIDTLDDFKMCERILR